MNVEFHPDVLKQLQRLPRDVLEAALKTIIALASEPRPVGVKKLAGRSSDWRVRMGQYRIVYHIEDAAETVTIFSVAKRIDVYR